MSKKNKFRVKQFEKDKITNNYTYTKYGMKKSTTLKDIYIESKNEKQLIWLNNIIC